MTDVAVTLQQLPQLGQARGREWHEQLPRLDLQRLRDPHDVHQRHIPFRALDLSDVVAVEAGQFGEVLLREISLRSQLAEAFAEEAEDLVAHSGCIWTCAARTHHLL